MTETSLLFSVNEAGVARIVLNRPDKGNAIDQDMADRLLDAAITCANDASIRCVVLTGSGRLFCAGGDVAEFGTPGGDIPTILTRLAGALHHAMTLLGGMRKPLVVLVNGPAAGAGLSLALSGDIVLAASSAHFTAAYGLLGLTPDGGMTWLLPRMVGMRLAQDIILTNRRVGAEEAAAIGIVTRVVAEDALAAEGDELAARLASGPTEAIGGAKALLQGSFKAGFAEQMDMETRFIAAAGRGHEGSEGIAAYLARRKPDFRGV